MYFAGLVIRAALNPTGLTQPLTRAVHEINKDQTLTEIKPLEQIKAESMATNKLRSTLLTVFASVALLLAAIGIYGVISYSVQQRTREIGIRAALGAGRAKLMHMFLRQGLVVLAAGLMPGLAAGFAAAIGLRSLFGETVASNSIPALSFTAAIVGSTVLIATLVPARKAASVDPLAAIRYE